jgi:ABC-type nitrate/sulfonate/bicarbonate transport system substrate-binding protein
LTRTKFGIAGVLCATLMLAACGRDGGTDASEDAAVGDTPTEAGEITCQPITMATLDDDSHRAQVYGIESGEVTSDIVTDIEVSYLQIPALVQATGSGQFDVLTTSLPGLVLAREASGLDLRIVALGGAHNGGGMALYVPAGSDIQSPEDLSGATLGTFSFGSSSTLQAQLVFAEKYGLDFPLEGGEITWVELDPPTLLNALEQGDVDVAMLFYQSAWLADQSDDLRKVAQLDEDFAEIADGALAIGSAFVSEGPWVEDNLECVSEFQRMMDESIAYAETNIASFSGEIAEQSNVPAEFVEYWWEPENYVFIGVPDDESTAWVQTFYDLAHEHGAIPVSPDVEELVVHPSE